MVLSTRSLSRSTFESLAQDYEIVDPEDVVAFLERYPELPSQLPEIREAIRRDFGDDRVTLSIFQDPECPEDEKLIANVLTFAGPDQALEMLKRFDNGWWSKHRPSSGAPFLVSIALQRRV